MPKKYSTYLKERFGARVHKVSVDGGFSCPNRDGKLSKDGCIYCNNRSFSFQNRGDKNLSLKTQIEQGIEAIKRKFKAKKFIIYFQTHTNTYAPIDELKQKYDTIRNFKDIVGIAIATRPDCVDKNVLELIAGYTSDYEVWLEYGLQSIHDTTLKTINRGHNYEDFLNAFEITRKYPIKICAHIILGLPNETKDMMMDTAKEMRRLKIDGIKIHPLHIIKGTILEKIYLQGLHTHLPINDYKELLSGFISCLWQDTVIQGVGAYCPRNMLVLPDWLQEANILGQELMA
ncbi:MAG: TIGR01212 family radical SAM protein [Candidatus Orphnella occulta]|nr:TIGR01212 family radical SAM protein [Candidatus Orphnella occulta]